MRQTVFWETIKENKARSRIIKSGVSKEKAKYFKVTRRKGEDYATLRGLKNADGKKIIPAMFKSVMPLSTSTALVRRMDNEVRLYDIKSKKQTKLSRDLWFYTPFDQTVPVALLLGTKTGTRKRTYCFTDTSGQCSVEVTGVHGPLVSKAGQNGGHQYLDKIVFNHVTNAKGHSTVYDSRGRLIAKRDNMVTGLPPVVSGGKPAKSKLDKIASIVYGMGNASFTLGDVKPYLYAPMDETGQPMATPPGFVGMFALRWNYETSKSIFEQHMSAFVVVTETANGRSFHFTTGYEDPNAKDAGLATAALRNYTRVPKFSNVHIKKTKTGSTIRYSVAAQKSANTGWVELDRNTEILESTAQAYLTSASASDPAQAFALAKTARMKATQERREAQRIADEKRRENMQGFYALENLRKRGDGMYFGNDMYFCRDAYQQAIGRSDEASKLFVAAYNGGGTPACHHIPPSVYANAIQAGAIVQSSRPAEETWSEKFDKKMQEERMKQEVADEIRGNQPLKCYVKDGRRICY